VFKPNSSSTLASTDTEYEVSEKEFASGRNASDDMKM
jgi:hypothetical protein